MLVSVWMYLFKKDSFMWCDNSWISCYVINIILLHYKCMYHYIMEVAFNNKLRGGQECGIRKYFFSNCDILANGCFGGWVCGLRLWTVRLCPKVWGPNYFRHRFWRVTMKLDTHVPTARRDVLGENIAWFGSQSAQLCALWNICVAGIYNSLNGQLFLL